MFRQFTKVIFFSISILLLPLLVACNSKKNNSSSTNSVLVTSPSASVTPVVSTSAVPPASSFATNPATPHSDPWRQCIVDICKVENHNQVIADIDEKIQQNIIKRFKSDAEFNKITTNISNRIKAIVNRKVEYEKRRFELLQKYLAKNLLDNDNPKFNAINNLTLYQFLAYVSAYTFKDGNLVIEEDALSNEIRNIFRPGGIKIISSILTTPEVKKLVISQFVSPEAFISNQAKLVGKSKKEYLKSQAQSSLENYSKLMSLLKKSGMGQEELRHTFTNESINIITKAGLPGTDLSLQELSNFVETTNAIDSIYIMMSSSEFANLLFDPSALWKIYNNMVDLNKVKGLFNTVNIANQNIVTATSNICNYNFQRYYATLIVDPKKEGKQLVNLARSAIERNFFPHFDDDTKVKIINEINQALIISPVKKDNFLPMVEAKLTSEERELEDDEKSLAKLEIHEAKNHSMDGYTLFFLQQSAVDFMDLKDWDKVIQHFTEFCAPWNYELVGDANIELSSGFIKISPFSLLNPATGTVFIAHELGHFISNSLSKITINEDMASKLIDIRMCLKQNHEEMDKIMNNHLLGFDQMFSRKMNYTKKKEDKIDKEPEQKEHLEQKVHQFDDGLYTEEDWADMVSAKAFPREAVASYCKFLRKEISPQGVASYKDLSLIQNDFKLLLDKTSNASSPESLANNACSLDTHSSKVFRIIHTLVTANEKLPPSCPQNIKIKPCL